jgi:hypothetical protein
MSSVALLKKHLTGLQGDSIRLVPEQSKKVLRHAVCSFVDQKIYPVNFW